MVYQDFLYNLHLRIKWIDKKKFGKPVLLYTLQYIYHLHIDNNGGEVDDHALPTEGLLTEQDFIKLFETLKANNYQGWYSFEIRPKQHESVSFILKTCKKFYDNFVAQD